jgi:hypothetical protein
MDADDSPGRGCPDDATVRAAGKVSEALEMAKRAAVRSESLSESTEE